MNWTINIRSKVNKTIGKFPRHDYVAIREVLGSMSTDPFNGDVEKMSGEQSYRRRVRNYRIKFELNWETGVINVYKVERRTTTTYRKR